MHKLDKRISNAKLADYIGKLDAEKKALEVRIKEAKAEFIARDKAEATGETYTIKLTHFTQSRIDTKAIRADMGDNFIAMYSNDTEGTRVSVRVNPMQLVAA
jgi:hypothetical protein